MSRVIDRSANASETPCPAAKKALTQMWAGLAYVPRWTLTARRTRLAGLAIGSRQLLRWRVDRLS